ncbi:MAG: hypothetical protein Q8S84_04425 [bacterium]|nr:hypothetical protein [bacterium]MDP3380750.1 hypothetical protein [bacterium]
MIGCLNELNCNTNIENIKKIEINKDIKVEIIKSIFSCDSHDLTKYIQSGKLYCKANLSKSG